MSYILDALRRAEAERERGQVPGLHAHPLGVPAAPAARPAPGAWTLPAIAVLGFAVVLLAWRPWVGETPPPAVPAPAVQAPPAGEPPEPPLVAVAPPVAAVAKRHGGPPASRPASAVAAPAVPPSPASAGIEAERLYALANLPDEVRRALPPVTIGGSIYSPVPANRFVIVGGQLYHEGDALAPGLVLQQVRLKSAVLSFRGYRYTVTF